MADQTAKSDAGKLRLSLVPTQIIRDVAEVRMYGTAKYGDLENWRRVEMRRYVDALYRHFLAFVDNPVSMDAESGLYHYKHMACNMAFICEFMEESYGEKRFSDEAPEAEGSRAYAAEGVYHPMVR